MRGLSVLLLMFPFLGCASQGAAVSEDRLTPRRASPALPSYLADPDHVPPPSCSAQEHRWATGQSSQGREAAELLAKKSLLSQINSAIRIEAETFSRDISVNGKNTSEFRQVARVLEKLDFAHADLIRVAEAPVTIGGETYVAVCMPRAEAITRLEADLAPEVKRFDARHDAAQQALTTGDRPAFVADFNKLSAAMADASPTLMQIRALANGPALIGQHLTSGWLVMLAEFEKLRSQTRFILNCQTDDHLQTAIGKITEAFRKALVPLGNEVRLDTDCRGSPRGTYFIQVSAKADCRRSSLGTTCTPAFEVRGDECSSGRQVFVSNLQRLSTSATDPGGEERALRRLIQRIDTAGVSEDLKAALKSELP